MDRRGQGHWHYLVVIGHSLRGLETAKILTFSGIFGQIDAAIYDSQSPAAALVKICFEARTSIDLAVGSVDLYFLFVQNTGGWCGQFAHWVARFSVRPFATAGPFLVFMGALSWLPHD